LYDLVTLRRIRDGCGKLQCMGNFLIGLLGAFPDCVTSVVYLQAWWSPDLLGPQTVKNLMLTMLIEVFVVLAAGIYGGIAARSEESIQRRLVSFVALTAVLLLFVAGFSRAFGDSWWPVYVFFWLFASRCLLLWMHPRQPRDNAYRSSMLCLGSLGAYALGVTVTAYLPLPELGLTPDFVASMQLSGQGTWIKYPQTVLAFGLIYFAMIAWLKFKLGRSRLPPPSTSG
jgi:hypothetical protein